MNNTKPTVTRIEIGRLYNTGSYEHTRYSIAIEVPEGQSAKDALIGLERIMEALSPHTSTDSREKLRRDGLRLEIMAKELLLSEEDFRRKHGFFEGTPIDYVRRCNESHQENVAKRDAWEKRAAKARELLDDLGGAAEWKDAKLDWERENDEP